MSCTSCSSGGRGLPAGCKNNGACGVGGCGKLPVFDWLANMALPDGRKPINIVEVRFKNSRKEFFKTGEEKNLVVGDAVAVEASPGHDIGMVSIAGELVGLQLKKLGVSIDSQFKTVYRKAKPGDIERWEKAIEREQSTMMRARAIAVELKLNMKISDVEYQGDGTKATFYYTAEDRVDFRDLIRHLADEFRIRVEMKQIGARQESGRLGGIGSCGRELCCSTWLRDFRSVNTSAARYQQLSLNPQKLAGQCGKLKCCLNYELDSYLDALKDFPEQNIKLETIRGNTFYQKTDIFKRVMYYSYTDDPGNFIPVPIERVKHIIALNKAGEKPDALINLKDQVVEAKQPDYENVVGQDSLTRFDQAKRSKNKKKKKRPSESGGSVNTGQRTTPVSESPASDQPKLVQHNRPPGNNSRTHNSGKSGNQSNWRNKPNRPNPAGAKQNPPSEPTT